MYISICHCVIFVFRKWSVWRCVWGCLAQT